MNKIIPIQKEIIRKVIESYILTTSEKAIILDIGCGLGDSLELTTHYRKAVGLEINADTARIANSIRDRTLLLGVIAYNGKDMPFKNDTFNLIYSMEVIEHCANDDRFLAECERIIKEDGLLILSTPNRLKEPLDPEIHDGHIRHYTKRELVSKLTSNGFVVKEFYWRMHPLCSFIDLVLTQCGRKIFNKTNYLGNNVSTYESKSWTGNILLSLYRLIEPMLFILVFSEFLILRNHVEGRNMLLIAERLVDR